MPHSVETEERSCTPRVISNYLGISKHFPQFLVIQYPSVSHHIPIKWAFIPIKLRLNSVYFLTCSRYCSCRPSILWHSTSGCGFESIGSLDHWTVINPCVAGSGLSSRSTQRHVDCGGVSLIPSPRDGTTNALECGQEFLYLWVQQCHHPPMTGNAKTRLRRG